VVATFADGEEITAEEILVSAGQRPLTGDLGLDAIGMEPGGFIDVDDQMRVVGDHRDWLYVVGDANGRSLLTHSGKYQARVAGAHIAGLATAARGDLVA
jgi:dihydrolipoamide dehydrogenase